MQGRRAVYFSGEFLPPSARAWTRGDEELTMAEDLKIICILTTRLDDLRILNPPSSLVVLPLSNRAPSSNFPFATRTVHVVSSMSQYTPQSSSEAAQIPQTPAAASPSSAPFSSSSTAQTFHHEDRLEKTWRTLSNCFVGAKLKAEKAAAEPTKVAYKELDDYVVSFLRSRLEWGRLVSYLEAKLEGKEKEMATLQHFVRSQPTLGSRKRKRQEEKQEEETKKPALSPGE